ncbi:MAG TPA: hypothetical protein VJ717_07475 [Gemmatimonadaceae bacterium]|nr:hypothetical protein [Gemmatimonadaceae bacterium]
MPGSNPCVLVEQPDSPPESITVALSAPPDSAGQDRWRTTAEEFVATQSYETLFGVDCRGRLYPKLVRAWTVQRVDGEQRWESWEITLDTSARFWSGERVTADAVLAAWRSTSERPNGELARLVAAATAVLDDSTLTVALSASAPLTLAHPSLAIHGARSSAASRARVHFTSATGHRDALDAGADLLVTDDPAIVSYAAHNDDILTFPLPWDRTYVVLASDSVPPDSGVTSRLTLGNVFADAVRAHSRIAEGPFWWESSACVAPAATRPVTSVRPSSRVVYLSGDRLAQGVAERLVALAGRRVAREDSVLVTLIPRLSRVRTGVRAIGLAPSAFAAALHAGHDVVYVLPLPRFSPAPCHEVTMLRRAAPWLQSVIPLIDTRSIAIVRRGRVGLSVDANGSLRLLDRASARNGKP